MECRMMFSMVLSVVTLGVCEGASKETEVAIGQFQEIGDEFYEVLAANNPSYASQRKKLEKPWLSERLSIADIEERKVKCEAFWERLKKIDMNLLPRATRLSYLELENSLRSIVSMHKFIRYGYNVLLSFGGTDYNLEIHQRNLARLPLVNKEDFSQYILGARSIAGTLNDMRQMMEEALRYKMVLNAVSLIANATEVDVEETTIYNTFKMALNRSNLPTDESQTLLSELYDVVNNTVLPAQNTLTTFMLEQYRPRARPCAGLWCLENGVALYQAHLQFHLSVDHTPDYIHQLGLKEVARIKKEMKERFKAINFNGTVKEFFESLKANTSMTFVNSSDMLNYIRSMVENRIPPALPKVFKKESIPTQPLVVVETRGATPVAFYRMGKVYGLFVINIENPTETPRNTLLSLALHEGLPGHHMQYNSADVRKFPAFRRYNYRTYFSTIPAIVPYDSASSEGWALYAEKLGYEMGLYENPFDALGQLEYELLRACRLVLDSGLHAKRWTRQRALDYLADHSSMTRQQLEFEIDRYITWPGQASGYKIGELKLLELREKAKKKLGSKFSIKEFNARILSAGYRVPLAAYDHVIDWWIEDASKMGASSASVHVTISVCWSLCSIWTILRFII